MYIGLVVMILGQYELPLPPSYIFAFANILLSEWARKSADCNVAQEFHHCQHWFSYTQRVSLSENKH